MIISPREEIWEHETERIYTCTSRRRINGKLFSFTLAKSKFASITSIIVSELEIPYPKAALHHIITKKD